ncbi:MAG: rod shape-determining protein [Patescibacteria group bacterium]|nr:rod shape-determining protein [Patescibacteria group bacterium]
MSFLEKFSLSVGIDLGTANTLMAVPGKGIIFDEPTVIARQKKKPGQPGKIFAFGKKAKKMSGREPQQIEVIEPLVDGAIADFDAAVYFLKYLTSLAAELPSRWPRLLKPRAVVGVPTGITGVEKRAVRSAALSAGFARVFLVEEPMLTAIGVGLNIESAAGNLLVDIGGGTTEIAVVSLGGVVLNRYLKRAGREMDESIVNFLRMKYGVLIGLPTAEEIKIKIGSVLPVSKKDSGLEAILVKGRDLETGLPKAIKITKEEIREALSPIAQEIVAQVKEILEETPPELSADISKRGIVLSGACSLLEGMEQLISQATKIPVWTAKNPNTSVVLGCVKLLENEKLLKKIRITGGIG